MFDSIMFDSVKKVLDWRLAGLSRRELFQRSGWLAAPALLGVSGTASADAPKTAGKLQIGPDIY